MARRALARPSLVLLCCLLLAGAAPAATTVVPIEDSGWYDQLGDHNPANENYVAGWSNSEFRNFFVFDLSGLPPEAVTSATLRLFNPAFGNPDVTYDDGFDSPSANEEYRLVHVATDAATVAAGGSGLTGIFDDLADGAVYGSHLASDADNGTVVEITLNAAAIAAIDAATGLFVLGGYLGTLDGVIDVEEHFFGHTTSASLRELVITTVPEPGSAALLALGLGALALRRRRARGIGLGAAAVLAATSALAPAPVSAATEIHVLSNRADLVSGGDALVEVTFSPGVDRATATVDLEGSDVTSQFAVRPNGRYMGLLSGLAVGESVLTVSATGDTGATLTIENHPIEGPVFSGPHLSPWECRTEQAGLGPPDAKCNAPSQIEFFYRDLLGQFQPYDPESPPAGLLIAQTTTDQGHTVPYIVRKETGAINRGIFAVAVLYDPTQPFEPWAPQQRWNGKLFYPFGASCGVNYNQGNAESDATTPFGVLDDRALSRGFAVATSSLNILGHHCDTVKSAETVMMVKEHIVEDFGEIRYTFGEGFSGGSIGQLQTANAYPGLLQGLIPGLTYPDVWTTAMDVADCVLLDAYFNGPGFAQFADPLDRLAVEGHGTSSVCPAWIGLFGPLLYPDQGCDSNGPDYDPDTQLDGCRSTVQDIQVNVWGRRPQDNFARRAYTNDGTQYGLVALNAGEIGVEQFLHLNENLGGADIDSEPTPHRTTGDPGTSLTAYSAARVNDGRQLAEVAIIDLPSPENVEIHTPYHAFSIEERLIKANGHADNHAIWRGGTADPIAPAFETMDAWLAAVEADASAKPLAQKIVDNRPAAAEDSCFIGGVQIFDETACDLVWPYFASTRIAAGSPFEKDIIQCTLKPPDPADYAVSFDPAQWQRLLDAFPNGVCDWSQPGRGQVASTPWMSFENGPGGAPIPMGPPPVSLALPEPGGALGSALGAMAIGALGRRRQQRPAA